MKFSKYNNPARRRRAPRPSVSTSRKREIEDQLYAALAKAETPEQKSMILDAYSITLNPCRK